MLFSHYIRRVLRGLALVGLALLLAALPAAPAQAIPPDSPEVKQMIERALKWLETQDDDRLGGQCLIGLSFFKAGRNRSHPKIVAALKACETSINSDVSSLDNYSVGLALIFLLETDPERNHSLARRYMTEVLKRQQRWGSWGYPGSETGDTSQTQYPTLGLWLAANHGMEPPLSAIERDCGWLLRTQDPNGGWAYQGNDPGRYQRVAQDDTRPAMVAAAMGSLYVCADLLGVGESKPKEDKSGMPSALKPVGDPLDLKRQPVASSIDDRLVRQALNDGNYWFSRHYTVQVQDHPHYYLYAFERYQSFRELAERRSDPNPRWYSEVVSLLKKTQEPEGSWNGTDGAPVSTSFCVLTLLRSTKKTLAAAAARLGEGVLLGGMGLPKNTADLQEKEGRIVESPLAGTIDELMTTIEKGNRPELERLAESSARWKLDSNVTKRSGEITRLRAVVSAGTYESRLLAVRALSRVREFDNVPVLIYALSDPDMRIVREADRGLRFISRKFDGVGLPDEPKPHDAAAATAAWKAWYQSIRPNAEFLD
jgi:hypothetical protein